MRIGEIQNIIKEVINDTYAIEIKNTPVYAGQAYQINNFAELVEALEILSIQKWNDTDFKPIQNIISRYKPAPRKVILTVDEFNELTSYVNAINPNVPLYYLTLDSLTEEQDEKTINIKLPENINSLKELNKINENLEDTLRLFNIDGQFEFKGFDKGTEWYVIVATGYLSYKALIGCLKITQEYFKARKEYFESEAAHISYEASLNDRDKEKPDEEFEKYKERWLKIFIETEVKKAIELIDLNGHTKEELHTKLIKATTKLVEQLDEGTEFHLSLNPPSYAVEEGGELKIDYKKIKETNQKELASVPKTINSSNSTDENSKKE